MFYCKDVKYDMCELKKNHDKKNKICKEFHDLTFLLLHVVLSPFSHFYFGLTNIYFKSLLLLM